VLLQRSNGLLRRAARNIASDWVPQRPKWVVHILCAAILLGLAAVSLLVDLPLARFLRLHPPKGDIRRLIMMGEVFGFGLSAGFIILTAVVLDSRRFRIATRLALYTYGAGACANILKALVARARPLTLDLNSNVDNTLLGWLPILKPQWGYPIQSFPSGHTATAVGLAIGLTSLYPRGRWLFASFAILTATQRIVSGAHFLSDTLVGAALAFLLAAAVERIFAKRVLNSLH